MLLSPSFILGPTDYGYQAILFIKYEVTDSWGLLIATRKEK